ncbi:MAG: acid shock protein [Bacteroidota bacterium]
MNKLYIIFMMFATLGLAIPSFATEANTAMETATEMSAPSKKEVKAQKKALRKAVRKAAWKSIFKKKDAKKPFEADILAIILAILIPPLGIWYYQQEITTDFWISLVLILLSGAFFFIGLGILGLLAVVHALAVVLDLFSFAS